jgi:Ca2+-binding EF-hand superfamily protein
MGADASKAELKQAEIDKLEKETHFNAQEIRMLYSSFKEIAAHTTNDGKIDVNEFAMMLGIKNIQFAAKIFKAFDENPDNQLDFVEYLRGLSSSSKRASIQEKASFVFRVYDADGNGTISKEELLEVMTLSLRENSDVKIPEVALNRIVNDTIRKMDQNGDGEISLAEFTDAALKNPNILNCVNVDIDNILKSK